MNDRVYIFDKLTFKRDLLGEIQSEFNMSLVIDGTKDSTSIMVWSYTDFEIEPYTILWHENTNTWWVVSHDKIERHENENTCIFIHNLDLLGAIELTNARDLTDCGFNDKTYTIGEFIARLVNLSTFEYNFQFNTEMNLNKQVDFLKTFENYTLMSAMREFLDAYNSCAKLEFATKVENNETYIDYAIFKILLKTGNAQLPTHNMTDFADIRETKVLDKNNFGTCVVSNADNVVSTQAKTYPATGLVGFSANAYTITLDNALIRLPTNVYKVNWLKMIIPYVYLNIYDVSLGGGLLASSKIVYDNDNVSVSNFRETIQSLLNNNQISQSLYQLWYDKALDYVKQAKDCQTVTLYGGCEYNPNDTFTKPDNVPYIPKFHPATGNDLDVIICPKEVKQNMRLTQQGIAWERGSNLITGFEILKANGRVAFRYTDGNYVPRTSGGVPYLYDGTGVNNRRITVGNSDCLVFGNIQDIPSVVACKFIINYIPMSDLKLKVDNQRDKKDSQLYNQNGKFTDSYALTKLMNSHSKEISSDTITRYGQYYDFDSVPVVGSFVFKDNETYVINNVSMNFVQNETEQGDFGYFIDCEFTMSKWFSTKSIMVNPNTNIRDYGIPQQYNVKRKQLFRDYYELDYVFYNDANQNTPYLTLEQTLNLGNEYRKTTDYSVYIDIGYDHEIEGQAHWYYQLDCSTIVANRQVVMLCDFKDNNIIGYSQNNRAFIFDVSHLFDQYSAINAPISYVDENGRLESLKLLFVNQDYKTEIDFWYYDREGVTPQFDALATQVFIPKELVDYALLWEKYDFIIDIPNYKKDALEIPFIEYVCQIDDSDNILIGDNILNQYEDSINFYNSVGAHHLTMETVETPNSVVVGSEEYEGETYTTYTMYRAIKFEYISPYEIKITMFVSVTYHTRDNTWTDGERLPIPTGNDLAIFRHSLVNATTEIDALLILKNVTIDKLSDNGMSLIIKANHYKLK